MLYLKKNHQPVMDIFVNAAEVLEGDSCNCRGFVKLSLRYMYYKVGLRVWREVSKTWFVAVETYCYAVEVCNN